MEEEVVVVEKISYNFVSPNITESSTPNLPNYFMRA
jgi:hypothetical protein